MSHEDVNGLDEHAEDMTPPKGLASTEFMVATWREAKLAQVEAKGARKAAETAGSHALDACEAVGKLAAEVSSLRTDVRRATMRPPPAMRAELPSGINLEEFARKVAAAALEGDRRDGTTPEEQVEKVIESVEQKREAAAIIRRNTDRAKRAEKILIGIVLAFAAALIGHYLK